MFTFVRLLFVVFCWSGFSCLFSIHILFTSYEGMLVLYKKCILHVKMGGVVGFELNFKNYRTNCRTFLSIVQFFRTFFFIDSNKIRTLCTCFEKFGLQKLAFWTKNKMIKRFFKYLNLWRQINLFANKHFTVRSFIS